MQANNHFSGSARVASLATAVTLVMAASHAYGIAVEELTDQASTVLISPSQPEGVFDWQVSGQSQLEREWWWIQTGGQRFSLDALGSPTIDRPSANRAITTYSSINGYSVQVTYTLTGTDPASGQALLKEAVSIQNDSGSPLAISLFMYSDFNLGETAGGDSVSLLGLNDNVFPFGTTVGWREARQADANNEHAVTFDGYPLLGEIGEASALLNKLNNTLVSLDASAALVLPPTAGAGGLSEYGPVTPADSAYAIQWDFLIQDGQSAGVGLDKRLVVTVIPEPGIAALGLLGLAGMLIRRSFRTLPA